MFDVGLLSKYYPLNSYIHKLNSTVKALCIILFIISLIFLNDLVAYIIIFFITLITILLSNVTFKWFLKTIGAFKYIIVIAMVIGFLVPFNYLGSVYAGLNITLLILYCNLLIYTTSFSEIMYAFERILSPLKLIKIPVKKVALNTALMFRFISVFIEQKKIIEMAEASRGMDYKLISKKKRILYFFKRIKPIWVKSKKKIQNIKRVMSLRLYDLESKRTNYRTNKFKITDILLIAMYAIILVIVVMARFGYAI